MKRAVFGWFFVIGAVTLAAYAGSFSVPFQFDDYSHIVNNDAIKAGDVAQFVRFGRTRILPLITLALNYRLHGLELFGYHVVNFSLHLSTTFVVYLLGLTLCATPRLRDSWLAEHRTTFAAAAALVFALHPIQVQAVTYIVQRISVTSALFYLASVLCYVRARSAETGGDAGRPGRWYAGTALCALAALLSKENAASLPLALLLTEWIFFAGHSSRTGLRRIAMVAAFVALIPLSWWLLPRAFTTQQERGEPPAADAETQDLPLFQPRTQGLINAIRSMVFRAEGTGRVTSLQYLLTQCLVVPRYLRMVIVPYGLNVDHDARIVRELSVPLAAGMALLLALIILGITARRTYPILSFGILWVFVALSVESTLLPIADPMVEHRMYLAMPGIAFIVATALALLYSRVPAVAYVLGITLVAVLGTTTFARNRVWRDPITLWGDSADKAPDKARPHVNLATALQRDGRTEQAIAQFCWALRLDPSNPQAKSNLNALAELQMDEDLESGEVVVLDGNIGADGTVEVQPRDLCTGR